jgi:hypothetical protein
MTTTLTDADIDRIAERMASTLSASGGLRAFARAVLAAQPAPVPAEPAAYLVEGWHDGKLIAHIPHLTAEDAKTSASVFCQHYTTVKRVPLYPAAPVPLPDEKAIDDYLEDYELTDGEGGCHTPNEGERFMLKDAIIGLLSQMHDARPAAPVPVPPGMALVPDYRGYAALGTGQYLLDISGDASPAELIIHVATEEEKAGRTVGDLRDRATPGEEIQPEKMAVRLAFFTVAGLNALEQQLRILRETHFPDSVEQPIGEVIISTDPLGREGVQVVKWSKDAPPVLVGMKLYGTPSGIAASPEVPNA